MGGGDIRRVPGAFIYIREIWNNSGSTVAHSPAFKILEGTLQSSLFVPSWLSPFMIRWLAKLQKQYIKTKLFDPEVRREFQRGSTTEQLDVSSSGESRETCLYRLLQVTVACMWTQLCVHRRKSRIFLSMGRHYRFFKIRNWNIGVLVKNK